MSISAHGSGACDCHCLPPKYAATCSVTLTARVKRVVCEHQFKCAGAITGDCLQKCDEPKRPICHPPNATQYRGGDSRWWWMRPIHALQMSRFIFISIRWWSGSKCLATAFGPITMRCQGHWNGLCLHFAMAVVNAKHVSHAIVCWWACSNLTVYCFWPSTRIHWAMSIMCVYRCVCVCARSYCVAGVIWEAPELCIEYDE